MTLAQYRRMFPNIDWDKPSPAAEVAMDPKDAARWLPRFGNPGPEFFREAAIAAASGERVPRSVPPSVRYWAERSLGLKPKKSLSGFPDYGTVPDHGRVITFLWLELLAAEQLR